jgi:hypothetical protein
MWWIRQERGPCYYVSEYGGGLPTGRGFPTECTTTKMTTLWWLKGGDYTGGYKYGIAADVGDGCGDNVGELSGSGHGSWDIDDALPVA